jgi:ribosomal protein L35
MAKCNKTIKSVAKRIKITKTDKIRHRACGQDHFNSRDNGKKGINKKQDKTMANSHKQTIKRALGK